MDVFFSTLVLSSPRAHLIATGEFDAFAAVGLQRRLERAVDRGCLYFNVDVSGVSFIDAGGLSALVRLNNIVAPYGGSVEVVACSSRFRCVAGLAGLGNAFGIDLLPDEPPARVPPDLRGHHTDAS